MILHSKKIIFVHIPRTAGTSITQFLKEYFNVAGVPEHLELYKKRLKDKGYLKNSIEKIVSDKNYQQKIMSYKYAKHATASHYLEICGKKLFDSFFKFTIIRNPWERMTSWFMHPKAGMPFKENEFIKWLRLMGNENQMRFLKIDNKVLVDKILRYENLKKDLPEIFTKLGIPKNEINNLPVINKSKRGLYQKYYNELSKKLVQEMFSEEIELFNYNF
jgi:hypothetical protein